MANVFDGQQVKLPGAKAGAGLTGAAIQYTFVKLSADNTVVPCTALTDVPIGVIQAPVRATGDEADVVVAGLTNVQASGSLAFGNLIGTDTAGLARAQTPGTDTTKFVVGQVISVAGATSANNLIQAMINCLSPARAA